MMAAPRFFLEGWLDESDLEEGWKLKADAPEDIQKEFEQFMKMTDPVPDEDGVIILA